MNDVVPSMVSGVMTGVGAAFLVLAGSMALLAFEAWRFEPARGALGAVAQLSRGWLHTTRDHDVVDAVLAALVAVVAPCVSAALVAGGGGAASVVTLAVAALLPQTAAPILAALACGPGSTSRLALDDALAETARQAALLTAVLVVSDSMWLVPIGGVVIVSAVAQRHRAKPGFQPRFDMAVSAGTRIAIAGGERAAVVVLAWLVGRVLAATLAGVVPSMSSPGMVSVVGMVGAVGITMAAVVVVDILGPRHVVGRGLRGPLALVIIATALRLLGPSIASI
jgi:hypothetical protein